MEGLLPVIYLIYRFILIPLIIIFLIIYFFQILPRRRRKKGKGSALERLKYVSVMIFLSAGATIIYSFIVFFRQQKLLGDIYCILGFVLLLLGYYVRKKTKLALWFVEGVFFLLAVPIIVEFLRRGVTLVSSTYAPSIVVWLFIGMGWWMGILNIGYVAIRDLEQLEEKKIIESRQ